MIRRLTDNRCEVVDTGEATWLPEGSLVARRARDGESACREQHAEPGRQRWSPKAGSGTQPMLPWLLGPLLSAWSAHTG